MQQHKAGFVNIVGRPNVGKSTLMNRLVGERLSIITSKAQTTRHRIMGILNGEDFQIVYSDTPGIIKPAYELHRAMMRYVETSLDDADLVIFVTDITDPNPLEEIVEKLRRTSAPVILVINKVDLADQAKVTEQIAYWAEQGFAKSIVPLSALHGFDEQVLLQQILAYMPEHPAFFDKEDLTDKTERFFASEILREKILLNYDEEIPYACEVRIVSFKEDADIIRISSEIIVERASQRAIIIGKAGSMLKKVGSEARKDMEAFFDKKVFLEQYVRVEPNWRKKNHLLRQFGYED